MEAIPELHRATGNAEEIRVNCEYCGDTKFHCYLNTVKRVYHCFRCGASGRVKDNHPRLGEYERAVQAFFGRSPHEEELQVELPAEYKKLSGPAGDSIQKGIAINYIVGQRQVWNSELNDYQIGYCGSGYYRGRVIIPVFGKGKLSYFVARSYTKLEPKYLNPHVEKKDILFWSRDFEKNPFKIVAVCEGVFDAIRLNRVLPAVALLGKEASFEQYMAILERAEKILVMLDEDAQVNATRLHFQFQRGGRRSLVVVPSGKDPAEVPEKVIYHSMRETFEMIGHGFDEALEYYTQGGLL